MAPHALALAVLVAGFAPPQQRAASLAAATQRWAHAHQRTLRIDKRLARAAAEALRVLPTPASADVAALRALAWRQGWRDAGLAVLEVNASIPSADLERLLHRNAGKANRVGVAVHNQRALLLFATQTLRLDAFAAQRKSPGRVSVSGATFGRATALWAVAALPDGGVRQLTVTRAGTRFRTHLDANVSGRYELQVLMDRGRGPEIAAHFPLGVGTTPWQTTTATLPVIAPSQDGPTDLSALIQALRTQHGVQELVTNAALSRAAQLHAEDMRDKGYFAHRSPAGTDARQRLRHLGVAFERVTENLAQVGGAEPAQRAVQLWLDSPAHRANLLDGGVNALGVAMVATPAGDHLAVAIFARVN